MPQSGIVWIASYPKSGNTWTRAFLHNVTRIINGEPGEQDINEMSRFSTWDLNRKLYAEILGFEPDNVLHRGEIAATRQKVHQKIADSAEGLIFIKTHNSLVMDRGYSTINTAVTAGVVYIIRNPLDVAISAAHHNGQTIDQAIEQMAKEGLESKGTDTAVYEVIGSWSAHVWSWTRNQPRAMHILRYEDMLHEPVATFGNLTRHLLLQTSPEQLAKAIQLSSFERLKAQEMEKGFRERPPGADQNFFREGRAGQWKEVLTAQQIDRIVKDHYEQMRRFGYLP